MLPKKNRLKKKKEFNLVFKKGKKSSNRFLEVKVKELKGKKIAFVAPVKIFKKATERNRVKRQLREAFKPLLSDLNENTGVVIIAKREIKEKSKEETTEIIKNLLSRIKNTIK